MYDENEYNTFEKYVFSDYNWTDVEFAVIEICKKYNRNIEYIIKYENIDVDICKLPYDLNFNLIKENSCKSNIKRLNDGKYSDYKFYYNQDLSYFRASAPQITVDASMCAATLSVPTTALVIR